MAYRILQHLAKQENWARDMLEEAYLDDEILTEAKKEKL
jgi:hypothetical protein